MKDTRARLPFSLAALALLACSAGACEIVPEDAQAPAVPAPALACPQADRASSLRPVEGLAGDVNELEIRDRSDQASCPQRHRPDTLSRPRREPNDDRAPAPTGSKLPDLTVPAEWPELWAWLSGRDGAGSARVRP
jgi:hypothetical protein